MSFLQRLGVAGVLVATPVLAQEEPESLHAKSVDLFRKGDHAAATTAAEQAVMLAEQRFGRNNVETALFINRLASLHEALAQHANAQPLWERALEICEHSLEPDDPITAASLDKLVACLLKQTKHAQAESLCRRALSLREQSRGHDDPSTTECLNRLVDVYKAQGRYAEAEPLAKRAVAIDEKSFGEEHPNTASSLINLAELYRDQGRPAHAVPLYRRAAAIFQSSFGPQDPLTAVGIKNLAECYAAAGRHAEAEPLCERLLEICDHSPERFDQITAATLNDVGVIYKDQGRYADAEQLFRRALAIRERLFGPDHPDTATSLNNLAENFRDQGQFARSEPMHRRAFAIRAKCLGSDDPETAVSLTNLAVLQVALGRHAEAEQLFKQSLAICEKTLGPIHPRTGVNLNNLADTFRIQGRDAEAEPLYKRAIAIYEKSLFAEHQFSLRTNNNLALIYAKQKRHTEAETLLRRVLGTQEKALGPDHPDTALCLTNLANIYRDRGQIARAEPLFSRAVAILQTSLGPDHPSTASSLHGLAEVQATLGRFSEASAAMDRSRRSTRRHTSLILPSQSAAEQRVFLRRTDEGRFHGALSLGLLQKTNPAITSLSAGWLANGKAVAHEAASRQLILARQRGEPATADLVKSLEAVRGQLGTLSQLAPDTAQPMTRRARMQSLQQEERRLIHEIGGQIAEIDRDEPWVEVDAIRKNIPVGEVLVDIARFEIFDFKANGDEKKWQPARYDAWVIPPAGHGNVTIIDLGPAEDIDAAVATYRAAIKSVEGGTFIRGQATAEEELRVTAAPLSSRILQPIVEAIGFATDIVLSPDGSLWLVPWQSLLLADGTYAIEKLTIRTVTSARDVVPVSVEAKGSKAKALVVADPAFDAAPTSVGKAIDAAIRPRESPTELRRTYLPLKSTRAEALATKPAIHTLTGREPRLLLGPEASETTVKQAAVRPELLILATHGFFRANQELKKFGWADSTLAIAGSRGVSAAFTTTGAPLEDPLLRCGLALAGANVGHEAADGDDGILTGAEIIGLDLLGTDLVVLSACETGIGQVLNGEGVAGLRQAFQIAGAKSVVATLWQVPDRESGQIMQTFYANVAKGQPPSKALREAQLAFINARREDRNYEAAHPYLWAAYGVTGR